MDSNINIKSWIKNVFNFKKPIIWIVLIAIMTVITIVTIYASSDGTILKAGSSDNQIPITNESYEAFAKDIIEKYYKNKDLGENNDFSKKVSNDALKLLNAKIELGQMQNKTLGYTYNDYKISVMPSSTDKWVESETEIHLYLRVERTWFYDNELYTEKNTNKTTTSEEFEITVSKNDGNELIMTECYELYENITLGPIDQLYKEAKASGSDTDTLIDDYKKDFQESLDRKRNQMEMAGSSDNQIPITNESYEAFAKDIIEKYYKNKDLGENNDFSKKVSNDALKLFNAKIELGQMQNKTLGYTYNDYKISVMPSSTDKWVESETEIHLYLRVERTWFYDNELYTEKNTNKTTTSEEFEITVSKNDGNELIMTECYELYENITLGPIDQLYKEAKASGSDTDTLIDDYKKDFQESLDRKRNQMEMDTR